MTFFMYLYDSELRVSCHDVVIIICNISEAERQIGSRGKPIPNTPEYQVSSLIRLPCVHKGNITCDRWFHYVSLPIKHSNLLLISGNFNTVFKSARIEADGYSASFDSCRSSGRGEERGYACTVCSHALCESTLRYELQRHIAV